MVRDGKIREHVRLAAIAGAALAVTAATVVGTGGTAAQAAVSYAQPGIAVADGNTVIAVQTSGDGLRFYWNQHGTDNWYGEQVAPNGTTFSAPVIIPDGNSVIIAAQGVNDSLDFYWQVDGTSPWNPEVVAGARTTYSAPSIALDGNSVIIAAEGPGNSLDFYWAVNGSPTWSPEIVAGSGTTYSAPAETVNGNSVNIAAEGPGNSLDFYWAVNGSATWHPEVVAGSGTTKSAPVIAASDNWVTIAAVNAIGLGLVSYQAQDGTATWNVTGNGPLGTLGFYVTAMVPSMVAFGGYDYIAETGLEGDLDAVAEVDDEPGDWWSNRIAPDNTVASSPALAINGNDINIAYIGGDGNLYFYWSAGASVDSDTWQKETVDTVGNL
jgi:hypothetical protein